MTLAEITDNARKDAIERAINEHFAFGRKWRATVCASLGISRKNLWELMKKYGIKDPAREPAR